MKKLSNRFFLICGSLCFLSYSFAVNPANTPYKLIVFLSPTCPASQYYTYDLNKIQDSLDISVLAIVPLKSVYKKNELDAYKHNFKPGFKIQFDKKNYYVKMLKPGITPEFFLLKGDSVVYQGAFDDKFIAIGNKNAVVKNHYVYDAIYALENNLPYIRKTNPVGCIIPKR